jgi:ribosomal protein L37AE/L43A
MKRWFYILLGGFGIMLTLWALFTIMYTPAVPPAFTQWVLPIQIGLAILGLILGWVGFLNGRDAGEFDVGKYVRSARKRDHNVNGTEIDFACPACQKTYRASPLLAGKPFSCRECGGTFIVQLQAPGLPSKPSASAT